MEALCVSNCILFLFIVTYNTYRRRAYCEALVDYTRNRAARNIVNKHTGRNGEYEYSRKSRFADKEAYHRDARCNAGEEREGVVPGENGGNHSHCDKDGKPYNSLLASWITLYEY